MSDLEMRYLATVGLAELVTQSHRVDRDSLYDCMGLRLVYSPWPELKPESEEDE